jgi:predicted nucleic acid-binding Zn ribbon protein
MEMKYCPNCGKVTGHKRDVGIGTGIGAVVTGGLSLGAVPFYPKRCIVCGNAEKVQEPRVDNRLKTDREIMEEEAKATRNKIIGWVISAIIVFIIFKGCGCIP